MKQRQVQAGHIKNLEWAIWLSRVNLDEFREGDWLNAKERLFDFIYGEDFRDPFVWGYARRATRSRPHLYWKWPDKKGFMEEVDHQVLRQAQTGIRDSLRALTLKETRPDYPVLRLVEATKAAFVFGAKDPSDPFSFAIWVEDPASAAQLALGFHLAESGIAMEQLRHCPQCNALFLLRRKPRSDRNFYCSLKCSRNAATRRYRQKLRTERGEEVKLLERQRSRRRYEARQQRKHAGAKLKIARRARS